MKHKIKWGIFYRRSGSTLIECLVYCFLCGVLMINLTKWVISSHLVLKRVVHDNCYQMSIGAAQDFFVRELKSASYLKSFWKKITSQEIIWQGEKNDIGWIFKKKSYIVCKAAMIAKKKNGSK